MHATLDKGMHFGRKITWRGTDASGPLQQLLVADEACLAGPYHMVRAKVDRHQHAFQLQHTAKPANTSAAYFLACMQCMKRGL